MNLLDKLGLVRVYSNGDGSRGPVKFYVSQERAGQLGLRIGDVFSVQRRADGALELTPQRLDVVAASRPTAPRPPAGPRPALFRRRSP